MTPERGIVDARRRASGRSCAARRRRSPRRRSGRRGRRGRVADDVAAGDRAVAASASSLEYSRIGGSWSSQLGTLEQVRALVVVPAEVRAAGRRRRSRSRPPPRSPGRRRRSRSGCGRTRTATGCGTRRPRSRPARRRRRTGCPAGPSSGSCRSGAGRSAAACRARLCGPGRSRTGPRPAAVAGGDPEHAVGAELQLAAVVVRALRVLEDDHPAARRLDARRSGSVGRDLELVDLVQARVVREVDVEQPRGGVVRREGDREQALLALVLDQLGDLEERIGEHPAAVDDPDRPGVLDHEQPAGAGRAWGMGDVLRQGEVADQLEARHRRGRGRAGGRVGGEGKRRERRDRDQRAATSARSRRGPPASVLPCTATA